MSSSIQLNEIDLATGAPGQERLRSPSTGLCSDCIAFKGKCMMIEPMEPNMDKSMAECEADFSDQCPDVDEELDDKFPRGLMKELQTTMLVDANHGHDKKT